MVCAYTSGFPSTKDSVLLVKIDASGTIVWSRSVEGESTNWPEDMIGTSDGGFLVVGKANSASTASNDIEAIKFGREANMEWVGIYRGISSDLAYGVTES